MKNIPILVDAQFREKYKMKPESKMKNKQANKQLPLNINTVIFSGSLRERSQQP